MLKVKLTIAYDGTNYAGWQVQKTGVGVQQKIEEAIRKIFNLNLRLHSSSRTDAGVHALGMVAHVEFPKETFTMTMAKLPLALNACLPPDIRVMEARRVNKDFHARFQAKGKQYRYFVWNSNTLNPLIRHQAWLVPGRIDIRAIRSAAKSFVGRHDFAAFAGTRDYKPESTVRFLGRCDLRKQGPLLTFIIEGDGFLYKMCRGIAGTLIQIGQGKFLTDDVARMLTSKDRRLAGMTAPAHGLVLWKVFYSERKNWKNADRSR